jgi:hypothetical protein
LEKTFSLMDRMSKANPDTQHFGVFIFTPFPSPLAASLGNLFTPPTSLEGWSDIDVFHFKPVWHSKRYVKKLETVSAVTRYAFLSDDRIREHSSPFRVGYYVLNRMAKRRWKKRQFDFPLEMKLTDALARKFRGWL